MEPKPQDIEKYIHQVSLQKNEAALVELHKGVEGLIDHNRIVVYGSNRSGAGVMAEEFQQFLTEVGIKDSSVVLERDVARMQDSFYGITAPNDPRRIPRGVIVFPEMRQYSINGMGMNIGTYTAKGYQDKTPFDYIRSLCEKHDVPIVQFGNESPEEVREGLKA